MFSRIFILLFPRIICRNVVPLNSMVLLMYTAKANFVYIFYENLIHSIFYSMWYLEHIEPKSGPGACSYHLNWYIQTWCWILESVTSFRKIRREIKGVCNWSLHPQCHYRTLHGTFIILDFAACSLAQTSAWWQYSKISV